MWSINVWCWTKLSQGTLSGDMEKSSISIKSGGLKTVLEWLVLVFAWKCVESVLNWNINGAADNINRCLHYRHLLNAFWDGLMPKDFILKTFPWQQKINIYVIFGLTITKNKNAIKGATKDVGKQ